MKKSLLQTVKNSIGSATFRNLYIETDGQESDALKDGDLSCAVFVSGILAMFGLIDEGHATVDTTVKHLKEAGWFEASLDSPEAGDIIVWDSVEYADGPHKHIGFYIGDSLAISNNNKLKSPQQHHWQFDGTRRPTLLLRYHFDQPKK